MKNRSQNFFMLILILLFLNIPNAAYSKSDPGDRKAAETEKNSQAGTTQIAIDVFIGKDTETIQQYFRHRAGSLPPGLEKRDGTLPPGLQKQLRRKGHLPPGLEKKITPFPVELERELSPMKPGLLRGMIEGRAVIYNSKTSVILDILSIF